MPTDSVEQNSECSDKMEEKPKLKADVRRALMFHSLRTDLPYTPNPTPEFIQKRAALRLRTLRTFFCCRSFSTVFFTPSEKQEKRTMPQLKLDDEEMHLKSASKGSRCLWLGPNNAHVDSEKRIWALGRMEVRGLDLCLFAQSPTIDVFRHWAEVLSTLEEFPVLDEIDVTTSVFYDSSWVVRLLRDFLPHNIVCFSSSSHHEHLFLAQFVKSKSLVMDRAKKSPDRINEHPYVPPFFRLPGRELEVRDWIPAIAANGPLERNEVVQKVIIYDELELTSYSEPWCVPGSEWSEQQARDYRTGFANLRLLNENFKLQILLEWMEFEEFANDQDFLDALVIRLVPLCAQIAAHAKEAGFRDVRLFAILGFVRQKTEFKTYRRMLSATKQFVDENPEFTCTAGMDAEKFKEALSFFIYPIADAWTITFGSQEVHFGFSGE